MTDKLSARDIWGPILTLYRYSGAKSEEISNYCKIDSSHHHHYLPMSMKILIGLKNLNKPNVRFTQDDITKIKRENALTTILEGEEIQNHSYETKVVLSSDTTIDMIEPSFIELAIQKIDRELGEFGDKEVTFNTDWLVKSIGVEEEEMVLILSYIFL